MAAAACLLLSAVDGEAASPRQVFAHYMVCFATYGESVEAYRREMQEAQAAGIDGFALNVGAWSGADTYYKRRVALLYQAAAGLGNRFTLFFSIDLTNATDVVDMVSTYAFHPASFRHQDRLVLSTFGGNDIPSRGLPGVDWGGEVFPALSSRGIKVCFLPYFWPDPVTELPTYADANRLFDRYGGLVDGLFYFGAAGLPSRLAASNADYARAARERGRLFMASVAPHYWGLNQAVAGRRYYEFQGPEGLALQWGSILASRPDWVEIVTWNDWNEGTYVAPVDDPARWNAGLQPPRRHPHAGYLEFSRRYIQWYKSGVEPAIDRDALFCSYRTHPMGIAPVPGTDMPVDRRIGDVQDLIYTTIVATEPAELRITSGGIATTNAVPAGVTHWRTRFWPGAQSFLLTRQGRTALSWDGPPVMSRVERYNFFPTTGFAYGAPVKPR